MHMIFSFVCGYDWSWTSHVGFIKSQVGLIKCLLGVSLSNVIFYGYNKDSKKEGNKESVCVTLSCLVWGIKVMSINLYTLPSM